MTFGDQVNIWDLFMSHKKLFRSNRKSIIVRYLNSNITCSRIKLCAVYGNQLEFYLHLINLKWLSNDCLVCFIMTLIREAERCVFVSKFIGGNSYQLFAIAMCLTNPGFCSSRLCHVMGDRCGSAFRIDMRCHTVLWHFQVNHMGFPSQIYIVIKPTRSKPCCTVYPGLYPA